MKWKYKAVMFLTLLIFCVGSVCATEPDNTTNTNLTDNQNIENGLNNIISTCNDLKESNIKLSNEIQQLKDNNTQLDKRVKALEESNKQLIDDNKALNSKLNNQAVIINELNNKLDIQLNENSKLQAEKDKLNIEIKQLNAEKCNIYERLLESPKKEDFEKLKNEIKNKDKQIEELNNQIDKLNVEIKTLRAINSVGKKDVVNSLKGLSSSTNIKNVKCGGYTFKLEDYLKIPLIKNGKNDVLKFKKDNGRLPNHVTIAGYKVPQKVYKKLFNI